MGSTSTAPEGMEHCVNLSDFERLAERVLDPMAWGYYSSGSDDMVTLRRTREAWETLRLRYRVLVDVSRRDTATSVLGTPLSMPILVAPTAFHKLAHAEGEVATARAAGAAGTAMILSTISTCSIEEVAEAATGPIWFQLYVYKDRQATVDLIRRAEAAGCQALVWTVDAVVWGRREPDVRNRFALPAHLSVKNLSGAGMQDLPAEAQGSGLAAYITEFFDTALTWDDLDWLRSVTDLPIVVKGIVRGDDAARAAERGARAIVVSNHGGRQLDTSPATIEVLQEVVDAADGRCEILIDGGVRRGTDVVKALALGARAVLIGRPALWGLAAGGQAGVEKVLEMLRREFDIAMALSGAACPGALTRDLIAPETDGGG